MSYLCCVYSLIYDGLVSHLVQLLVLLTHLTLQLFLDKLVNIILTYPNKNLLCNDVN